MTLILYGWISGLTFSLLTIALMLPMKWENSRKKIEAILAAAIERLIMGVAICSITIVDTFWLNAVIIGLFMSLPSAILTRAYAPIIIIGILGALIIGIVRQWAL